MKKETRQGRSWIFYTSMIYGTILMLCFFFAQPVWAEKNSCLDCHSKLDKESVAGKAYTVWKDSVHDKAGITCDRCHGGESSEQTLLKSHANAVVRIHYARIPKLCGSCHKPQWNEFTRSRHYKALVSEKDKNIPGPTCTTCHGTMHTGILAPNDVADACRKCHNAENNLTPNIPIEAHATLELIFYTKTTVQWSGEFVALAKSQGYPVISASQALKEAEEKFHLAEVKWHSLDFNEILQLVDQAYEAAKKAKRLADKELSEKGFNRLSHSR